MKNRMGTLLGALTIYLVLGGLTFLLNSLLFRLGIWHELPLYFALAFAGVLVMIVVCLGLWIDSGYSRSVGIFQMYSGAKNRKGEEYGRTMKKWGLAGLLLFLTGFLLSPLPSHLLTILSK